MPPFPQPRPNGRTNKDASTHHRYDRDGPAGEFVCNQDTQASSASAAAAERPAEHASCIRSWMATWYLKVVAGIVC